MKHFQIEQQHTHTTLSGRVFGKKKKRFTQVTQVHNLLEVCFQRSAPGSNK